MIGKLATRDTRKIDNSHHKSIRVEVEVRTGITIREIIRIGRDQITGQIAETEDNTDRIEVGLNMNKIIGEVISRVNVRSYGRQNRENIETIT